MKISEKFLKYFGVEEPDISKENEDEPDGHQLMEMEIEAVLAELASEHPDTDKYRDAVQNLKTLTEAYEHHSRARADFEKAQVEMKRSKTEGKIDWGFLGPRIASILVYGLVTITFVAIEREHPPAMRMVQAANTLLAPKFQ